MSLFLLISHELQKKLSKNTVAALPLAAVLLSSISVLFVRSARSSKVQGNHSIFWLLSLQSHWKVAARTVP